LTASPHGAARLGALIATLLVAAGCGGGGSGTASNTTSPTGTQTTAQKGAKQKQPASTSSPKRCRRVPRSSRAAIRRALKDKRTPLDIAQAVRSASSFKRGLRHPYFVSGFVTNKKHKPGIATWVTRNLRGGSFIVPVGSLAHFVTAEKAGRDRKAQLSYGVTQKADGYQESRTCAQNARKAQRAKAKGSG
jgi:hypothetical protein